MKDRLIELLRPWCGHSALAVANDLLANGVTVQEDCKACAEATQNCIVKLQEQIAELRSVQEWISVKDRLPDKFINVLCYFPEKDYGSRAEIDYAETTDGHFASSFRWGHPTHWMPLPQPPKGE